MVVRWMLAILVISAQPVSAQAEVETIFVVPSGNGVRVFLNDELVNMAKWYQTLAQPIADRGVRVPLHVICSNLVEIQQCHNVRGMVGAVGYLNYRYFVANRETGMMVEISHIAPAIPIPVNGSMGLELYDPK